MSSFSGDVEGAHPQVQRRIQRVEQAGLPRAGGADEGDQLAADVSAQIVDAIAAQRAGQQQRHSSQTIWHDRILNCVLVHEVDLVDAHEGRASARTHQGQVAVDHRRPGWRRDDRHGQIQVRRQHLLAALPGIPPRPQRLAARQVGAAREHFLHGALSRADRVHLHPVPHDHRARRVADHPAEAAAQHAAPLAARRVMDGHQCTAAADHHADKRL